MNRYSNYTQSQFNPLSMEEIFTVPLAKQAKHDQAQAALDELGLFDLKRLKKDDDLAEGYINQYTDKINQEVDSINQSGINNQSLSRIKAMARDRQKWLTQGDGKDIKANYDAYIANKAQLDKQLEKNLIGADKYQLGLQQALERYKGVAEGDRYDAFNAIADTDYIAEALKLAEAVPTQEREAFLVENGYQLSSDGSTWVHGTTGQKFTKPGAIADIVMRGLGNNSNIMADLEQRAELGLFGDRTRKDVLKDLALTMERDLAINSISLDPKLTGNKGYDPDNANNVSTVYNEAGTYSAKAFDDKTMDVLNKIGTETQEPNSTGFSPIGGAYTGESKQGGAKFNTLDNTNISPEVKTKLQTFANKIVADDQLVTKLGLKNADINDPDTFIKVREYIKKFQDLNFTQNVVSPNSNKGQLNSLPTSSVSLNNASKEYIKTEIDAGGIKVYDQETGEILDDSDLSKIDNIKFRGYYSPDNAITELKGANEATMTSPGEILAYDSDNKKLGRYYISRPTSDMDSPQFQAAKIIKDIKVGMINNLGLPTTIELPRNLQESKGFTSIDYSYDPDTSLYSLNFNMIDSKGNNNKFSMPDTISQLQLNSIIYRLYNIEK